jgi:hypothetical protein
MRLEDQVASRSRLIMRSLPIRRLADRPYGPFNSHRKPQLVQLLHIIKGRVSLLLAEPTCINGFLGLRQNYRRELLLTLHS